MPVRSAVQAAGLILGTFLAVPASAETVQVRSYTVERGSTKRLIVIGHAGKSCQTSGSPTVNIEGQPRLGTISERDNEPFTMTKMIYGSACRGSQIFGVGLYYASDGRSGRDVIVADVRFPDNKTVRYRINVTVP